MKLQEKTLLIFVLLLIGVLAVVSVFFSSLLLTGYRDLEEQYVEKDLRQAVNKLNDESSTLSALVTDYGPWDDTYNFVNGHQPDYVEANLVPDTYNNLRLNLIIITNRQGEIVYSGAFDLRNKSVVPVPAFVFDHLDREKPLLDMNDPRHATAGILMLPNHPVIIASRPIVHTDFTGEPQGVVIMGRYLDDEEILRLAALTTPGLSFFRADDPVVSPQVLAHLRKPKEAGKGYIEAVDKDRIAGYALIRDIYGADALVLSVTQPRDIYNRGISTAVQFILIILCAGLFLGFSVVLMLDRIILSRMGSLSLQVHTIGRDRDLAQRVYIEGNDELSGLGSEINSMLSTIETTQKQIQASETRFRELADLLPQVIFEMDTSGNITYLNKYGLTLFGLSGTEISSGVNARQFVVPEDWERMERNLSRVAAGERSTGEVYTFIKKEGSRIHAIAYTAPILREGVMRGFRGSVIDITERKRAEEALAHSEEKYRTLTENTGDILVSTDMAGNITYVSPQVTSFGFSVEEVIGKNISLFIHPEDWKTVSDNLKKEIGEGAQFLSTFRILDKGSNIHWFEEKSSVRYDPSGKPAGINGILREITERKRAEEAIELANKKLNLMNNITRHDILNTLTGLFGCVDMANSTQSDHEREELLFMIKDLGKNIQRQIAFTREYQEVGVHLPQWQNISEVIQRVLLNFENTGIRFVTIPTGTQTDFGCIEFYADPMLEKVFFNLIDNAVRYGEKITTITINYQISESGFSLVIEDDGAGIPDEQKTHVFDRGVGKNTGMGLFLSREILGITRISIVENGISGKGARFEILVPHGSFRTGTWFQSDT